MYPMTDRVHTGVARWDLVAMILQATRRGDALHVKKGAALAVRPDVLHGHGARPDGYPLVFDASWHPGHFAGDYPDLPLSPDGEPDYRHRLDVRRALLMLSAIDLQLAWLELPLSATRDEALRLRDEGPEESLPQSMWEDYLSGAMSRPGLALRPAVLNQLYPSTAVPIPVDSLEASVEYVATAPLGTPPPTVLPDWVDLVTVQTEDALSELLPDLPADPSTWAALRKPEPDDGPEHVDGHMFADCEACGRKGRPLPSIVNDLQLVTQTLELVLDELHNQKRRVRDLVLEVYEDAENKAQDMKSILDAIDHVQSAWQHALRARQAAKDVAS